jgi:hypothetical protein
MKKFVSLHVKGLLFYHILAYIISLGVDLYHAETWTDEET